jgi:hypothetical protein
MKPDRSNYEILLIDYLDGALDKDQAEQLMQFLEENPDIKEELSDIVTCNLKPASGSFKNKNSLKRSFSELGDSQFEYLCISAVEENLSGPQKAELETIVAENPEKRKVMDLYRKTILVAPEVNFRHKSALRRLTLTQKIIRLSALGLSAAAGIALFVLLSGAPGKKTEIITPLVSVTDRFDPVAPADEPGKTLLPSENRNKVAENLPLKVDKVAKAIMNPPVSEEEFEKINISKLTFIKEVSVTDHPALNNSLADISLFHPAVVPQVQGPQSFIAKLFRERILKTTAPESGSLKPYEIADAGIIGLNKLFGWQMSLKQNRNKKGELTSLYFSSRILKFNTPVKKML